jgi:hypothetical protein
MATENPPYAVQADSHGAELFRLAVASTLPLGVRSRQSGQGGIVNPGDLAVAAGTGNTVTVATGECWVAGTQGAHQSMYYCFNDATVTGLTITPNASNPLVAIVTASVNDQAYTGNPGVTNNQWGLLVTQGTAASSPSIPATPDNSLVLATILVPANASSSSSYTIVQGLATISGTTLTAPAGLTTAETVGDPAGRMYATTGQSLTSSTAAALRMDSVSFLRGGMTASNLGTTSAALVVPVTGLYQVEAAVCIPATSGVVSVGVYADGFRATNMQMSASSGDSQPVTSDIISIPAGTLLAVWGFQSSGSSQTTVVSQPYYQYLSATLVSF